MQLTSKYNIHDKVFYMEDNNVCAGSVYSLVFPHITPLTVDFKPYYLLSFKEGKYMEYQLFESKKALLDSL